jgi:hypothetical protein
MSHRHDLGKCIITHKGKLVCDKTGERFEPMTERQKECASRFIGEQHHKLHKGKRKSHEQAIAIGLSLAKRKC